MLMEGGLPTIHYQRTSLSFHRCYHMRVGQSIKLRFIGRAIISSPMHVHGGPFTVVARDGATLSPTARYEADNYKSGPGHATMWSGCRRPGKWLIHCHIHINTENDT